MPYMRPWPSLLALALLACSSEDSVTPSPAASAGGGGGGTGGAPTAGTGGAGGEGDAGQGGAAAGSSPAGTGGAAAGQGGAGGAPGGQGGGAPVCAPGQSISCTGPAGCKGGQACKADGSGYEACDCGSAGAGGASGGAGGVGGAGGAGGAQGGAGAGGGPPVCGAEACSNTCAVIDECGLKVSCFPCKPDEACTGDQTFSCKKNCVAKPDDDFTCTMFVDKDKPYAFKCFEGEYALNKGCKNVAEGSSVYCCLSPNLE